MEQCIYMKFCFKLGKTATETHGMLVQVYNIEAISKSVFSNDLNALETEKKLSRMSYIQVVNSPQSQSQTTLNKCDR